ncbi:MAG: hypothetical protein LBU97_04150, partial [Alistipes sp.]|nr:hypothetical protein [Alistipes sp.]
ASNYADPLYDFVTSGKVEVTFNTVAGVPTDAQTLDLKFYVGSSGDPKTAFELRDCPINWPEN